MTIATYQDWTNQADFKMHWCIFDAANGDGRQLDLNAPAGMPDGVHTVFHRSELADMPPAGVAHGVVVKDGQFELRATEAAIYQAVCRSYGVTDDEIANAPRPPISHIFVESITWHPDAELLEVECGS